MRDATARPRVIPESLVRAAMERFSVPGVAVGRIVHGESQEIAGFGVTKLSTHACSWKPDGSLSNESLAKMQRPHADVGRVLGDAVASLYPAPIIGCTNGPIIPSCPDGRRTRAISQ